MEPYQLLEAELARWSGSGSMAPEHVVSCSSGTAALHLALEALRLRPGTFVVVPDHSMVACARAVTLAGLRPVFVDCDEDGRMKVDAVEDLLRVSELNLHMEISAVMAVHVYGRRVDVDSLAEMTRDRDVVLVEDLAEAHGVPPHPWTHAACWSFYRNKIVPGEEGGAVAFWSPTTARLARSLRSLGFTDDHDYAHRPRGHNYRMSNLHAEAVRRSLREVELLTVARRGIEEWYDAVCPAEVRRPLREAPWVYDVRIPGMTSAVQTDLVRRLRAGGIEARHGFKPMTWQEEYRSAPCWGGSTAGILAREVIYLPIQPGRTTDFEVRWSMEQIAEVAYRS